MSDNKTPFDVVRIKDPSTGTERNATRAHAKNINAEVLEGRPVTLVPSVRSAPPLQVTASGSVAATAVRAGGPGTTAAILAHYGPWALRRQVAGLTGRDSKP